MHFDSMDLASKSEMNKIRKSKKRCKNKRKPQLINQRWAVKDNGRDGNK